MNKHCFLMIIMFLGCAVLPAGCRAKKELKASERREQTSGIGVELRRVDSLWSSIAERKTVRIEFYPQTEIPATLQGDQGRQALPLLPATGGSAPTAPQSTMPADSLCPTLAGGWVGGMGAVKSIEIATESGASTGAVASVDSALQAENHSAELRQTEKASEARHDNTTVLVVSVVAAVALLHLVLAMTRRRP